MSTSCLYISSCIGCVLLHLTSLTPYQDDTEVQEYLFFQKKEKETVVISEEGSRSISMKSAQMSNSSNGENISPCKPNKGKLFLLSSIFPRKGTKYCKHSMREVIHSVKVGIALVLVSLLYLLDPLFKQVGENAMWAIMTVVVVFEFTAGATLSKGINRAIGTILGGGLGCLVAILSDDLIGIGNAFAIGISVFLIGAAATYSRLIPKIKRRYDYGAMIFILTFSLVAVSGLRADKVMKLAKERLSTIGMGFGVCIFTSLLIFPIWASDELHQSTAFKFDKLANCIEGCLEEYFTVANKEANVSGCKSVFHSKSTDESLANFAKWEPWHGKFGLSYPWEKYLEVGEVLRGLAALILSLKVCIQSSRQPTQHLRDTIREPCEIMGLSMAWILRELGDSISMMKLCRAKVLIVPKLHSIKLELSRLNSPTQIKGLDKDEYLATSSFIFLLMEITDNMGVLAEHVEQLGELAGFETQKMDV